jgi:hypothetical protein
LSKKHRFRKEHITIATLRFRLAHADAVKENGEYTSYSEGFKNFILNRYDEAREKLTRRQFARAAEIPVSTLRLWLAQTRRPLLAELEASVLPLAIAVQSPEKTRRLAKGFGSLGRAIRNFGPWIVDQVRPEPAFVVVGNPGYGIFEVRKSQQKFIMWGVVLSVILNIVGIVLYEKTLKEGETLRTVSIMKYVELPQLEVEEPKETKKVSSGGGGAEPSAGVAGNSVMAVSDQFVPMADVIAIPAEVADLAQQLGRPSLPTNGTALGNIVPSSSSLALPTLNMGSVGPTTPHATDFQNPAGVGVPSAFGSNGQGYTPGLQPAKVSYGGPGGGGGSGYSTGRDRAPANERKPTKKVSTVAQKVEVKEKNLANVELDKIFQELVGWLQANQSELSETVKKCLGYKEGDITATVNITVDATSYDLYFLCNDKSQDIGILLAEQGQTANATLLRDTGFRKKSFYLSQGIAARDDDNSIISTSMLEQRPSAAETSRFYNIFLSWWDKNKP